MAVGITLFSSLTGAVFAGIKNIGDVWNGDFKGNQTNLFALTLVVVVIVVDKVVVVVDKVVVVVGMDLVSVTVLEVTKRGGGSEVENTLFNVVTFLFDVCVPTLSFSKDKTLRSEEDLVLFCKSAASMLLDTFLFLGGIS